MLEAFFPDEVCENIFEIDLERLSSIGIKGFILDIDNTLVKPSERIPNRELLQWIEKVRERGFQLCILSNASRKRVSSFSTGLGIYAISKARKPASSGFMKAVRLMELDKSVVCMVGDQLFTDVYGAKKIGIYTLYTRPIVLLEVFTVMLKRIPEYFIMRCYNKRNRLYEDL